MIISNLTPLPYPPYRVTNMEEINRMVLLSDTNHLNYVHPCEQLRNAHKNGTRFFHTNKFFFQAYYLTDRGTTYPAASAVWFEYI